MATQYTVWVGGSEIGTYFEMDQAQEVYDDWVSSEGYTDVEIEVVDTKDQLLNGEV